MDRLQWGRTLFVKFQDIGPISTVCKFDHNWIRFVYVRERTSFWTPLASRHGWSHNTSHFFRMNAYQMKRSNLIFYYPNILWIIVSFFRYIFLVFFLPVFDLCSRPTYISFAVSLCIHVPIFTKMNKSMFVLKWINVSSP